MASTGPWEIPPPVLTPSTWPQYGLPRNYSPPYETTSRGGGLFNPRNPPPVTQYHTQGWQPPPPQVAVLIPQMVSAWANRSIFPEMFRQMPPETSHTNNTVESLAVFRQQIEESHHDLVNLLTRQMATMLTPMIENNNARIEQVAQQVNDLAENMNPAYTAGHRNQAYNYNNPLVILHYKKRAELWVFFPDLWQF
ncbi:hypothetical protein PIB30_068972 [Stylosanthes scabra]|uniref:Uncharacterized protein n=1 Tax=Stylosanthes scabra TaxID=79078 RepID=A0ABU6XKV5_9FABA|nr:hypothetical protein [Stylosanthes scabra]